jgi:hypothetical protein
VTIDIHQSLIENSLKIAHGELMGGADLMKTLGFKTRGAFYRAHRLGYLTVRVFEIPNRKGKFALTTDVAIWLQTISNQGE